MANKDDRLTIRTRPAGLWSHAGVKPVHGLPEDRDQGRWLLFFASSISCIGLCFTAVFLISCNWVATSGGSSTTRSANSLRITTAEPSAGAIPVGYRGSVADIVEPSYGKSATAANAFSPATPSRRSALSIRLSPVPLQITTGVLPAGTVQSDYDTALEATGGVPPYHWDATAGRIAPGLTLRSSTGSISGIPFAPGAFLFTARVEDSTGASLSTTLSLNISPVPAAAVSAVVPDEGSLDGGTVVMISDESHTSR